MILYDGSSTFDIILRWKGSVLHSSWALSVHLVLATLFAAVMSYMYNEDPDFLKFNGAKATDTLGKLLAFLLVFRSKLSYDRYWEGRNLVTKMRTAATEFARKVPILVWGKDEAAKRDRANIRRLYIQLYLLIHIHSKKEIDDLLEKYNQKKKEATDTVVATRARSDTACTDDDKAQMKQMEIHGLLTEDERNRLLHAGDHFVMVSATWLTMALHGQIKKGRMHLNEYLEIEKEIAAMIATWQDMEKITCTPFPFPYTQMCRVFNVLFNYTLGISLVSSMGNFTPVATFVITLGFFGLDCVSQEIEDPFGEDENDLPMTEIVDEVQECTRTLAVQKDGSAPSYPLGQILEFNPELVGTTMLSNPLNEHRAMT